MFMSSGHWQNTGLARWINKNLYHYNANNEKSMNPMRWHLLQNDGDVNSIRETINGFPCRLILVNDGTTSLNEGQQEPTPGNTKDMGIFNFNNDKDNLNTMGMDTDIFPNCISFEVTANSDTSAGAFVPFEDGSKIPFYFDETDSKYVSSYLNIEFIRNNFRNPGLGSAWFSYDSSDLTIKYYNSSFAKQNYDMTLNNGSDTYNNHMFKDGVVYAKLFASTLPSYIQGYHETGGIKYETRLSNDTVADTVWEYSESNITELEYLQNSFELRYPDSDDVGSDYGYLGVEVESLYINNYNYYGNRRTSSVPISYFGTNTFTFNVSYTGTYSIVSMDSSGASVDTLYGLQGEQTVTLSPNATKFLLAPTQDWEYVEINGVKYYIGDTDTTINTRDESPYTKIMVSQDYGLKRVIDWVGNCTDEEFVAHYEEYFDKHYLLRYYLLVITLGMVDNLGKNMMFDTWDGQIWYPRFYDMDTICSYDNSGAIKFDVDIEMAQGYWNTSASRLWTKVRDLLHDELVVAYKDMRASGLSYDGLMNYFYGEQIAKIPQKYYNQDADVKYLPYADEYLGKAHGDGYEHLKRWLKNRLIFTDTLYDYGPSYESDMLTIRANTLEPITFEIETYTPVYQHVSYYNGQMSKLKIDGKTATTFTGNAQTATDQEILIYGGSNIKRIRGISSANPDSMLIGKATRLAELDISNCPILTEVNSNKANFAPHSYLNKLNIENCPNLGGTLGLSNSPLIQEIKAKGTAVNALQLSTSVKNLETLELPNTITSLALYDASSLETLKFDEGVAMQSIELSNCPGITNTENFDLTQTPTVILDNSYDTEELYMSETTNLTLRNMSNLERVIYTPNSEYSEFDINNVIGGKNYKVTTNGCPKLTTFMTTAPQRLSYNNGEHGDITPNTVFTANTLDLSNTQFTDIKLLCTTDVYNLKVPTTMKNFYCDSAMDIDTDVIEDASYEVIHEELIEPYTTNYEDNVVRELDKIDTYQTSNLEAYTYDKGTWSLSLYTTDYIQVGTTEITTTTENNYNYCIRCYDSEKTLIGTLVTSGAQAKGTRTWELTDGTAYVRVAMNVNFTLSYKERYTPNIIPSSANGSLIFNMYSNNTTQPTSTSPYMWDLTGLKLEDFHTYGMNNWVKADGEAIIPVEMDTRYSFEGNKITFILENGTVNNGRVGVTISDGFNRRCIYIHNISLAYSYLKNDTQWTQVNLKTGLTAGVEYKLIVDLDKDTMEFYLDGTLQYQGIYSNIPYYTSDGSSYKEKFITVDNENMSVKSMILKYPQLNLINENVEIKSITMPQRMPGYSVRLVNADITPDEYPTMLYPKLIDTTLPITGKLDYTAYNGTSLAWAYAYTTGDVEISPVDSRSIGQITNDYNKLYGTDFVDLVDVWVYKDTDVSQLTAYDTITKAYIELSASNYTTRVAEITTKFTNIEEIYLFDNNEITIPTNLFEGMSSTSKGQINKVVFIEGHFNSFNISPREYNGLESLPVEWGGFNFTTENAGIYILQIPSDNYTVEVGWGRGDKSALTVTDGVIDWGDGNITTNEVSHVYTTAGTYIMKGHTGFKYGLTASAISLLEIVQYPTLDKHPKFYGATNLTKATIKNLTPTSCESMFDGCPNLTDFIGFDTWDMTQCKSMELMFNNCSSPLTIHGFGDSNTLDLSSLNLPAVEAIEKAFRYTNYATVKIPHTPKLTTAVECFRYMANLTTINRLPTSDVNYCLDACLMDTQITTIEYVDYSKVINTWATVRDTNKLTNVNFAPNSQPPLNSNNSGGFHEITKQTNLTTKSLLSLFNALQTIGTLEDGEFASISLAQASVDKLSETQLAIPVNKGWTINIV